MDKTLILAYYLPQFHPFKENDEWWGKGFTEWTNVGKAKPLFKGHIQPNVPADLGYYDLRLLEVRIAQAELARKAGVDGFCYWHYWFGGEGRQLMNRIIDEVAATNTPNYPFCIAWANESWKSKIWNKDGKGDKIIMEQRYEGEEDYRKHYEYSKTLFTKENYIKIENKPFFMIYKPGDMPNCSKFLSLWNKWIKEDGIASGFYFVGGYDEENQYSSFLKMGFDAMTSGRGLRNDYVFRHRPRLLRGIERKLRQLRNTPIMEDYKLINKYIWIPEIDLQEENIPFIIPRWDHTPRSGRKGSVMYNSTPNLFYEQAVKVLKGVSSKKNKLVFLKSWNEWGEGNYMEPDLRWGKGYIEALRKAVDDVNK